MHTFLFGVSLLISGKTDRKGLREIGAAMSIQEVMALKASVEEKRAPTTSREKVLQRMFSATIGIPLDEIGADDGFFQLGGDSISAIKLVSAASLHGFTFTVTDIFATPVLCDLAARESEADAFTEINESPEEEPIDLPLTNPSLTQSFEGQTPLILIHDGGGTTYVYHCLGPLKKPVYSIHYPNFTSAESWPGGMKALAQHYASLIQNVVPAGHIILGGKYFIASECILLINSSRMVIRRSTFT
jgi:hypothetical protein